MKNITLLLLSVFFLYQCQQQQLTKTHGISYLDKREKLIIIHESNKNDVIKALGEPNTTGMTNDSLWIYIERTKSRGKILKLGRDYLTKNNVLVLEFNKFGVLETKKFYDKDNMKEIKFAKDETVNEIKKENFIYSFLSSIRQKMETKRK